MDGIAHSHWDITDEYHLICHSRCSSVITHMITIHSTYAWTNGGTSLFVSHNMCVALFAARYAPTIIFDSM